MGAGPAPGGSRVGRRRLHVFSHIRAARRVRLAGVAASGSIDRLLAAAGLDPADGVQVVALDRVTSIPFDPGIALILLAAPGGSANRAAPETPILPGRHARSTPHRVLTSLYP